MASHRPLLGLGGTGWRGLENEGTNCEAETSMARDFIFCRLQKLPLELEQTQ